MRDDHIFADLEEKFEGMKNGFDELLSQLRSKTAKTVYCKGYLENVLPYEHELLGF